MSSDKPIFEAREPGFGKDPGESEAEKKYTGAERRKDNRRQKDRRGEVRFDPNSNDRRKSDGSRKEDKLPKFW